VPGIDLPHIQKRCHHLPEHALLKWEADDCEYLARLMRQSEVETFPRPKGTVKADSVVMEALEERKGDYFVHHPHRRREFHRRKTKRGFLLARMYSDFLLHHQDIATVEEAEIYSALALVPYRHSYARLPSRCKCFISILYMDCKDDFGCFNESKAGNSF
jgi:hypothetical protein